MIVAMSKSHDQENTLKVESLLGKKGGELVNSAVCQFSISFDFPDFISIYSVLHETTDMP